MNPVFLDASGLIAVANTDDQWHFQAEAAWNDLARFQPALGHDFFGARLSWGTGYRGSTNDPWPLCCMIGCALLHGCGSCPSSLELEAAAWELFRQRPDKTWGVTDCASFVVMKQLGIETAFTVDRHFEQAGFQRLIDLGRDGK